MATEENHEFYAKSLEGLLQRDAIIVVSRPMQSEVAEIYCEFEFLNLFELPVIR